jgi:antitoxin component of MazEF toxin-antitoxin module
MGTELASKPPLIVMQRLRKLLELGNSFAVTIPTKWVRTYVNPKLKYVTTSLQDDGSILLRPFNPNDPIGEECLKPIQ